ncbi:MAG: phosphotransferase [Lachnospiraceae bacterium]|nr:phosphotransferase [Lachnospiraceae bacterium]
MDSYLSDDRIKIDLKGKIDAENASTLSGEINAILTDAPDKIPVFDASDLKYISSSGLRVLLDIKKRYKDEIFIIDVSPEVYEIFDMTGFTGLFSVRKKMRELSVDGCPVLGRGGSGVVYSLDKDTVIKVFYDRVKYPDIEREITVSKELFVAGVPTAIPYDIVRVGESYATVFEYIDATTLYSLLLEDQNNYDLCLKVYTDVLCLLRKTIVKSDKLRNYDAEFMNKCREVEKILPPELSALIKEFAEGITPGEGLVHGDYHLNNVMYRDGNPMLIDLGTIGTGSELFDPARSYYYLYLYKYGISPYMAFSPELSEKFYYDHIDLLYGDRSETERREIITKIKVISYISGLYYAKEYLNEPMIKAMYDDLLVDLDEQLKVVPK